MKLGLMLSILGTLLAVSCGYNAKSREEEKLKKEEILKKLSYLAEVKGTWSGPCEGNLETNFPAGSSRVEYLFSENTFLEKHTAYESKDCSGQTFYTFKRMGQFKIHDQRNEESPEASRKIDLVVTYAGITPNKSTLVDQFNLNKTCSIDNWVLTEERPISSRMCWGALAYPKKTIFTIFTLLDNDQTICLGKADDVQTGLKASERPTAIGTCYERIQ